MAASRSVERQRKRATREQQALSPSRSFSLTLAIAREQGSLVRVCVPRRSSPALCLSWRAITKENAGRQSRAEQEQGRGALDGLSLALATATGVADAAAAAAAAVQVQVLSITGTTIRSDETHPSSNLTSSKASEERERSEESRSSVENKSQETRNSHSSRI